MSQRLAPAPAPPAARTRARARARERVLGFASRAIAMPLVAYGLIAALQMRVLWGIWKDADLTNYDTSFYYRDAASWAHGLHENVVYYPLYDAFWGTILAVVHDVYAATIIQRVAIIVMVALLVLAVMRALLGPALGLAIAAWWALVPANYDVLYEVHLFGAIPLLLVLLVIARAPRREGLGVAVAILLASAVLVRSELIAAAAILALVGVLYELRELRAGRRAPRARYARAYLIPLAIACVLIGGAYERSYIQGHSAWGLLAAKEEASFCNDYAASYGQRHPTRFTGNPFTECEPLMRHDFGRSKPTLVQAIAANPRAVAGFAYWDAQLLPAGLQVAMLGATSSGRDPSFRDVNQNSSYALLLSLLLALTVLAGAAVAARAGKLSLRRAPPRTRWMAIALAAIALATLVVVLTTRPWAEYMYGLTVCVLVVIGAAACTLVERLGARRLVATAALAAVVGLIVLLPPFYSRAPRPIYEAVQHLQPVRVSLQRPGSVLVAEEDNEELCNYLAYSYVRLCKPVAWSSLRSQVGARAPLGRVLARAHATALYVDAAMLGEPAIAALLAAPRAQGWQQIGAGEGPSGPWRLLVPVAQGA